MNNYNLNTGKKHIKEIFAHNQFYNIPEYQRPYVWGKEQVYALLDDLKAALNRNENKEYFLGCMIWNTKSTESNGIDYRYQDILDGQQRFITLYLLHGVIRDLSNNKKIKEKVLERLKQEADDIDNIPERSRIEFEIRDDKDFLRNYLEEEEGTLKKSLDQIIESKDKSISVKNMAAAIFFMRKWWEEELKDLDRESADKEIKRFFTYLSNKVLILYLSTDDNLDDAYNLFTVLNSRGLQLQVSDILRAQNLRAITDSKERKRYAEKWIYFEDIVKEPFSSFDDFLWSLIFIKMKYRSDDNQSLTKAFDHLWKKGQLEKGTSTFNFVNKYIDHYQSIASGELLSDKYRYYFSNLNFILSSVFGNQYIILLMYYRELFGDYKILDFFIKVDNLFTLPWLLGKKTSQTRMFILLRKMKEISKKVDDRYSMELAADSLLSDKVLRYDYNDPNASTKLEIEELFNLLESENFGSYAGIRINKTRYLLLKLDLLIGSFETMIQFNKSNSSIEHIIPRKLKDEEWNISQEDHEEWLHKLGNLVLLNRKKNASLSNKSYKNKKEEYKGAIESRANTNYVFMNNSKWDIESLKNNHKRVVNILKAYYEGNSLETVLKIKRELERGLFIETKLF